MISTCSRRGMRQHWRVVVVDPMRRGDGLLLHLLPPPSCLAQRRLLHGRPLHQTEAAPPSSSSQCEAPFAPAAPVLRFRNPNRRILQQQQAITHGDHPSRSSQPLGGAVAAPRRPPPPSLSLWPGMEPLLVNAVASSSSSSHSLSPRAGVVLSFRSYHVSTLRRLPVSDEGKPKGVEGEGSTEPPSSSSEPPAGGSDAGAAASPPPKAPDIKEYSYPELTADAAKHKAGLKDPDVPSWQNPLHHNNPEMQKVFPEDFATREEFEASVLPAPPVSTPDNPGGAPAHILDLADEIVQLNMLEMSELVNKIADHYGFHEGMLSPDGSGGGGGGVMEGDDDSAAGAAAAPAEEKTAWDIRLVSYQDSAKIKVIKEVRSLAGLGLKEAKELVEGAPKVVLKQVKTEDAEAIKAKLEELGATVELT